MFCVLLTVCGWVSGWVVGWLLRSKLIELVVISDSNSTHNTQSQFSHSSRAQKRKEKLIDDTYNQATIEMR